MAKPSQARALSLAFAAGIVGAQIASCASETGSCIPGTLKCICDMSGVCDAGLVCEKNRCVNPDEDPTNGDDSTGIASGDSSGESTSSGTTGAPLGCDDTPLRVASYNVQAVGYTDSAQWNALGAVLRRTDVDVVCIEELDDGETAALRDLAMALDFGEPVQADPSPGIGGKLRNACMGRVPLTRVESYTASDLSPDPNANDVGRDFLAMRVEARPGCYVSLLAIHAKSGQESIDLFRRQVEYVRLTQAIELARAANPDDPLVVMGDHNENLGDPALGTVFDAPPDGLPPTYVLGNDIEFPLVYQPFDTLQSSALTMVDATQEDSDDRNTWAAFDAGSGVRLDYVWLPAEAPQIELSRVVVYNTCLDDGVDAPHEGAWLPFVGDPLPCSVGPAASDHLPIVADFRVP